jgi:hypothetical protein
VNDLNRLPSPLPLSFTQLAQTDLGYIANAQYPAYDIVTGLLRATDPFDIIFDLPGAVTASTSPPVTPKNTFRVTGLSATLGTAGSSDTTVELLKDGSVVASVTLGSGATYGHAAISPPVTFVGRTDRFAVAVSTAGTGAADLGGGIEIG